MIQILLIALPLLFRIKLLIVKIRSQDFLKEDRVHDFPDIHQILLEYNDLYFYGSLGSVIIKWSTKMTSCAGKCTYEPGGRCIVSLSEPLLKYRTVKELRETILHELIHAYLFVTASNKDRNSHGPEFHYHMNRINKLSGLNVTKYHNFYDELNYYKRYIWRCNGICRNKPPYFGYIRRSVNREPNSNDRWWINHKRNCGGSFIREGENEFERNNRATSTKVEITHLNSESENDIVEIVD